MKPKLISICALSFTLMHSAHASEVIDGKAYVYPFNINTMQEEPTRFPEKDSVRIIFVRPQGVMGDDFADPDSRDGAWRGKFTVPNGERDLTMEIRPEWRQQSLLPFITTSKTTVDLTTKSSDPIKVHFYHPIRFARDQRNRANGMVGELRQMFPCARSKGNAEIVKCWKSRPNDLKAAQAAAQKAIDKFDESIPLFEEIAYTFKVDEVNTVLWPKADLQLSVGLFCDAATSFGAVLISEPAPGIKILSAHSRPYSTEASIACAMGQSGQDKMDTLLTALERTEAFVNDPAFTRSTESLERLTSDWFELFQLAAEYPGSVDSIAAAITSNPILTRHWTTYVDICC